MVLNAIDGFFGEFTVSDIEKACPMVGRDWVRTLLQRLKQEGRIEALSKGRYARWRKVQ
jgi:predicted transcriptional regulator of viral defense system